MPKSVFLSKSNQQISIKKSLWQGESIKLDQELQYHILQNCKPWSPAKTSKYKGKLWSTNCLFATKFYSANFFESLKPIDRAWPRQARGPQMVSKAFLWTGKYFRNGSHAIPLPRGVFLFFLIRPSYPHLELLIWTSVDGGICLLE